MIKDCNGSRWRNSALREVVLQMLNCSITFKYCLGKYALSFLMSPKGEIICLIQSDKYTHPDNIPKIHHKIYAELMDAGVSHIYVNVEIF
jgi:hypothetical protein